MPAGCFSGRTLTLISGQACHKWGRLFVKAPFYCAFVPGAFRRQRSEQYFTFSQSRSHFLRQEKGNPHTRQVFVGSSDFLRIFITMGVRGQDLSLRMRFQRRRARDLGNGCADSGMGLPWIAACLKIQRQLWRGHAAASLRVASLRRAACTCRRPC